MYVQQVGTQSLSVSVSPPPPLITDHAKLPIPFHCIRLAKPRLFQLTNGSYSELVMTPQAVCVYI